VGHFLASVVNAGTGGWWARPRVSPGPGTGAARRARRAPAPARIPEPDRALQPIGEFPVQQPGSGEQFEGFPAFFGQPKTAQRHEPQRQIDARLTRPLQIQKDRVLSRPILMQMRRRAGVFLRDAPQTPLDRLDLGENDVVRHRQNRAA
jgi:hypothetical protein